MKLHMTRGIHNMKPRAVCLAATLLLGGCLGNSSTGNEATGQVKRVQHQTPIFCPDYYHVDISLGVVRNGTGSMSTQDTWLWVPNDSDVKKLEQAAQSGALVKITYDVARGRWFNCVEHDTVRSVEVIP